MSVAALLFVAWARGAPEASECRAERARAAQLLEADDPGAWSLAADTGRACASALPLTGRVERWSRQAQRAYDARRGQSALRYAARATAWALATAGPGSDEVADTASLLAHSASLRPLMAQARPVLVDALDLDTAAELLLLGVLHEAEDLPDASSFYERVVAISDASGRVDADVALALHLLARKTADPAMARRAVDAYEASRGPDHHATAWAMSGLAEVFLERGDHRSARPLYEQSLASLEASLGPSHPAVAMTMSNLAVALKAEGDFPGARALYERSLASLEASQGPSHPIVAQALNNLALLLREQRDWAAARLLYERSLTIIEAARGPTHPDVARGLRNLANLRRDEGEYAAAQPLYERSLAILEATRGPSHVEVAGALDDLARVLYLRGDLGAALPLYERALGIRAATLGPSHPDVATSLAALAGLLKARGDLAGARALSEQSVALLEQSLGSSHPRVAASVRTLASVRVAQGDPAGAVPLLEQSLRSQEAALGPKHREVAFTLQSLAFALDFVGDLPRAQQLYVRAQEILEEEYGPFDHRVAVSLANQSWNLRAQGDLAAAKSKSDRALPLALRSEDIVTRWAVFQDARDQAAAEGRRTEAILWGKMSVQAVEHLHRGLDPSDADAQEGFRGQYEEKYRALAELLVMDGRLPEAEQVLSLIKADEQYRYLRRDSGAPDGEGVAVTVAEADWIARFGAIRGTVVSDAREYQVLRTAAARGPLSLERQGRLEELAEARDVAATAAARAVDELRAELTAANRGESWGRLALERSERVQRQLGSLGAGAVLVHVVVLEDHVLLLLTTPVAQVAEEVPVASEELQRAVAALRQALTDPSADPRPAARRLYDWILRPLEPHLAQAEASTLLLSLDGPLRYLPMAALHDGERYVVERWATSVYTPAAEADFARAPAVAPFVAAFGASRGATVAERAFAPLPSIPAELDAVVRTGDGDAGAVDGRAFLDEAFSAASLADSLHLGTPWIHVASHFHFAAGGTEADSFLVLGDGTALSVADLRLGDFPLAGVDLLALSACQTAMSGSRVDGSEVEGLAVVAQNKGAAAVLATLWPVADASTAAWMAALYAGQVAAPVSRAAAVRRVQRAFLAGEIDSAHLPSAARGLMAAAPPHQSAALPEELRGWRHPYYWAPFVLYGAGR